MKRKKIKVAYISADKGILIGGHKGASVHIRNFCEALKKEGCLVHIFTTQPAENLGPNFKIPVYTAKLDKTSSSVLSELGQKNVDTDLTREIKSLMSNSSLENLVIKLHSKIKFDFIYERYSLWSIAGVQLSALLKIPFILEVNSPLIEEEKKFRTLNLESLAKIVEKFNFSKADKIMVVSEALKEYVIKKGISKRKVEVLPNAVNSELFNPQVATTDSLPEKFKIQKTKKFILGFVGSLKPWHGIRLLTEAFLKLYKEDRNYHLLVVGEGPEKKFLEEVQKRSHLNGALTLLGAVPHHRVPGLIQHMDVAIAPYPKLENFYFSPLKLFEYMAMGKPVVASNSGQIKNIIKHGQDGLLFTPGNQKSLIQQIEILRNNPHLRQTLGEKAAQKVLKNYVWEKNAQRVLNSAEQLANRKNHYHN